jgi:RHS repeat-associated protein
MVAVRRAAAASAEALESRLLLSAVSWNGGTGNWNVAANWDANRVPNTNDDVTISAPGSVVNVTDSENVASVTTIAGTTLHIAGTLSFTAGTVAGTLTASNAAAINDHTLNLSGTTVLTGTTIGGGSVSNSGSLTLTGAVLGNVTFTNTGSVLFNGGSTLQNSSTVNNAAGATFTLNDLTGISNGNNRNSTFFNSGTLTLNGGSGTASIVGITLVNDTGGAIDVQSGTLSDEFNGSFQNAAFNIATGAAFAFDNISSTNGTNTFDFSGTNTGNGGGHVLFNGGQATDANPDGTAPTSSILNFPAGFAQVTGTSFNTGNSGEIVNAGSLDFVGSAGHSNLGLINQGTINVTGSGDVGVGSNGTFTNAATGILNFESDANLVGLGGNTAFANMGLIEKTAGTGESIIGSGTNGINFSNPGGAFVVQSGTLSLQNNASGFNFTAGTITVATGATLDLNTGNSIINGSGVFTSTGGGRVTFSGGTWNGLSQPMPPATFNFAPGIFFVTGGVFADATNDINTGTINYTAANTLAGLDNKGTILFPDAGPLSFSGTVINETAGVINLEADTAINILGNNNFQNNGTILKSSGTGMLDLSGISLTNGGIIRSEAGTIVLPVSLAMFAQGRDTVLAGSTYEADAGATIALQSGSTPLTTIDGTVILNGIGATFSGISGLTTNNGTFEVLSGATFVTGGNLTNTGTLTVGGSLTVAGNFIESQAAGTPAPPPPTLSFAVTVPANAAGAPNFTVNGSTTLGGNLTAAYTGGFGGNGGSYTVATFATAATGSFADTSGVGPSFTPVINPTSIVLNGTAAGSADLAVTNVSAPASFTDGQTATITWNVANQGQGAATGTWFDAVYLSKTATFNSSDILLGAVIHSGPLAPSATYQGSLNATLPSVAAGKYFVLVVADAQQAVPDTNRENNLVASPTQAFIPVLPLGGSVTGTIAASQDLVYQLTVPGGEDILVSETLGVALENQVDISKDVIPTTGAGQYSATLTPGSTSATVNLHLPQAGTYYLLLRGDLAAGNGQTFTLAAQQVAFAVYSASPNAVGQGNVTINVVGSGFTAGSIVQLVTSGGAAVASSAVTLLNADTLSVNFDLTSVPTATYGVSVTSGLNTGTLANAVTVQAATANLSPIQYTINAPSVFRPGLVYDLFITYTNPNNVDVAAPVFELDEPNLSFRLIGGDPGAHIQPGLDFTSGALQLLAMDQEGVAGVLPAGYTGTYEIAFQAPANSPPDATFTPTINDDPNGNDFIDLTPLSQGSTYSPLTWQILADEMSGLTALPTTTLPTGFVVGGVLQTVTGYLVSGTLQPTGLGVTDGGYEKQIRSVASTLSKAGVYDPDAYDLLNYALGAADQFGSVTQRVQNANPFIVTPGLGVFGQGTPDPLYYDVNFDSTNGIYNVVMPSVTETFTNNLTGSGPVFIPTNPGDSNLFSQQSDGTYRMTAKDGSFYQFNLKGRLAYFQAGGGQQTIFNYDTNAHVTSIIDTNGGTTRYTYDPIYGIVTSSTDPFGNTTTFGYEFDSSLGIVVGTASPLSSIPLLKTITTSAGTTTIAYTTTPVLQMQELRSFDPISGAQVITDHFLWTSSPALAYLPTSITLPDGSGELFSYDNFGRPIQTSQLDGTETTNYSYDASGLQVTATIGSAVYTSILSVEGSVLKSTDPNGAISAYSYAANGLLSSVLSPSGAVTSFGYNADGTLGTQTSGIGGTSTMTYDSIGRLMTLTDGDSNVVGLAYDAQGNLKSVTQPDHTLEQYQYTSSGLLNQLTQRNDVVISIGRDPKGDITSQTYSSGASYSFSYDPQGNMLTAHGPDGLTTYTYYPTNFVATVTGPDGHTLTYAYNSKGEVSSLSNGGTVISNYSYDTDARLMKVTDGAGNLVIQYDYDSLGRISLKTFGNGTSTVYAYTALDEILSITNLSTSNAITSSLTYSYDLSGQPTSVTDAAGNITRYAYDLLGELTTVTLPNGGGTITYTYDANGNRKSVVNSGTTTTYTVNNMNEYSAVGLTTYTYDLNGNMATMTDVSGVTTYTHNANDQLVSSSGPGGNFTYTYDALFELIAYTDNGVLTKLVRGPAGNVVAAFDANGNLLENYQVGIGLVAATSGGGTSLYYQSDALGNVTATTNGSGSIINTYSYLPYGEKLTSTGPVDNIFTYSGANGVMDLGDGNYQTLSRTYSPSLGRFLQNDPNGKTLSANLYEYVGNAPTDGIDPTGEEKEPAGEAPSPQGSYVKLGGDVGALGPVMLGGAIAVDSNGDPYITADAQLGVGANVQAGRHAGTPQLGVNLIANAGMGGLGPHVEVERNLKGGAGEPETEVVPGSSRSGPRGFSLSGGLAGTVNLGLLGRVLGPKSWQLTQPKVPWTPNPRDFGPMALPNSKNPNKGKIFGSQQQRQRYRNLLAQYHHGRSLIRTYGPFFGDPNDIFGPGGFGAADFVAPAAFPYLITFANETTATAAAPTVVVTQQLSSNLDWSTFQLRSFGFGSYNVTVPAGLQSYETKVDATATTGVIVDVNASFNASTGLLTWTFTSLDPKTLLLPLNALAGFLPPDNAAGDGEGYVNYTISPKRSDITGTTVQAQATIVFGNNAPINTPLLLNTLDNGAPTSMVAALPATQTSPNFDVSWAGQDDANGSGIASFTIFVSTDGGAFSPWLTTSSTTAVYVGALGHSYGFHSIATDNVGNSQAIPSAAQAQTAVPVADRFVTFGGKTKGTYTDAAGNHVTVTLSGPGTGTLGFIGSGSADPVSVVVMGTTAKSVLTIRAAKGTTTLTGVQITGSLANFSAKSVNLTGSFDITGTLRAMTLNNVNTGPATIDVEGAGATTFAFGTLQDLSLTDAGTIRSLSATSWTNGAFASDALTAAALGKLSIKGAFDANLSLTSGSLSATIGSITGGAWNVGGSVRSLTTGTIASGWAGVVTGNVGPITVRGDLDGSLTAPSIKSLRVTGSVNGSTLTLTGSNATLGRLAALGSFTVTGNVSRSNISAAGNVGPVSVGGMSGSTLFAGITSGITGLPTTSDFTGTASIVSFSVAGKAPFANSDVAAEAIGAVTLRNVTASNGGTPFGVATKSLRSFALLQPKQKPVLWHAKQSTTVFNSLPGDLKVQLV